MTAGISWIEEEGSGAEKRSGSGDHVVDGDAEFTHHRVARCRGSEPVDGHNIVDPPMPALGDARFDSKARQLGRMTASCVSMSASAKRSQLGNDTTRAGMPASPRTGGIDTHGDLTPGAYQRELGVVGLLKHIGAMATGAPAEPARTGRFCAT